MAGGTGPCPGQGTIHGARIPFDGRAARCSRRAHVRAGVGALSRLVAIPTPGDTLHAASDHVHHAPALHPMTAPSSSLPLANAHRARTSVLPAVARLGRLVTYAAVVALTVLALTVRVTPLAQPDGALSTDEARLGLAADGVLASGLPILPSGRVYTRGLVTTYAIAPSFALFGRHDWSARLPSALAGALLVPVMFVFARRLADATGGLGAVAGLAAAGFVAVADPL